ncbi:tail fiber assembly protein [Cedecea neteri]|uniref:tail fiber assembly protein n=1 Tax=Cedecea neteri TaxID=158822 RepID=UPI002AA7E83A|nr:tail fiber assembly protein [Cedecea neteri]WPU24073.1 tail fiber assembly protein [Cedecea neteri]
MSFKMSEEAQTIKIYNLRADTQEFIGVGDAYIPPHTGLPANSTDITPPEMVAGKVAVFNFKKSSWSQMEDHRGKTVYDTRTGNANSVTEIGPLPENSTSLAPDGAYQKWNGNVWVKDNLAEKADQINTAESTKVLLMRRATESIELIQDAVDLDMATDAEKARLPELKKYRLLLSRVDTSTAPDIEWPEEVG